MSAFGGKQRLPGLLAVSVNQVNEYWVISMATKISCKSRNIFVGMKSCRSPQQGVWDQLQLVLQDHNGFMKETSRSWVCFLQCVVQLFYQQVAVLESLIHPRADEEGFALYK